MQRGTRVGQAYVALAVDGDHVNEEIASSVEDAGPAIEKSGDEHGERYGNRFSDRFREKLDGVRDKVSKRLRSDMGDVGDESGNEFSRRFEGHFNDDFFNRLGAHAGAHFVDALNFAMTRGNEDGQNPIANLLERWTDDVVSGNGRGGRGGGRDRRLGDLVGRMFGEGSRNNFLNVLGKGIGGLTNGIESLFKMIANGPALVGRLTTAFKEASSVGEFFTKIGGEGGGMFTKLIASGPGAVVAIVAITLAASVMVSVFSALLALVTALVASIAGALTGALLVGAGAMGAMGVAAGLLTAAFMSMTDAQKKLLTEAFRPLKAEMVGIGQIMLTQMVPAFSVWSANLQRALMLAVPVAQVMGKAFADAGTMLTASLSGPGFQMLSRTLTEYLPGIVTKLSYALGQFLNGMAGLFSALLPYVDRFAGYLGQVATRFANWATSAQGQNAIVGFVDRALAALKSLWNFVTAFGGFLVQVFFSPEAMGAGNNIFDSMAETFRRFTAGVKRAQADGSFKKWFDNAIKFGGQLWAVIQGLYKLFIAFYNSGVLSGVGHGLAILTAQMKLLAYLVRPLTQGFGTIGGALSWLNDRFRDSAKVTGAWFTGIANTVAQASQIVATASQQMQMPQFKMPSMPSLQQSGMDALNATSIKSGGFKPPKTKAPYHNPYKAYAQSLIREGPSTSASIKNAILSLNKQVAAGVRAAARDTSGAGSVQASLTDMISTLRTTSEQQSNTARTALNNAAQALLSASSKGAAAAALRKVHQAQKDLNTAIKNQQRINNAIAGLATMRIVKKANVDKLVAGLATSNVTLAEFAAARAIIATKLAAAQQKLTDAISLRDDYKKQIEDSIKSYGDLASAQAQSIDGIEQALTANDITSNLQTRLDKIKKFQSDLQLLLAQGLSNDAYKQIVDQGVDQGTTLADALLAGGNASIQQTNTLVSQIDGIAAQLGLETSSRLYQAGVDAAQGLVDGLTSQAAQLEAAATKLGNAIAAAVKKSLGIHSPSIVMRDMMDSVGDGTVIGLNNQQVKVGGAAAALADLIAVNPGGGKPPAGGPYDGVSGNGGAPLIGEVNIHTPTEDPEAVAHEAINELVGRLP